MAGQSLAEGYQRMSFNDCLHWPKQRHVGEEVESVDLGPLCPGMSFPLPPVDEVRQSLLCWGKN